MRSTFRTLNAATLGLAAQQVAIETTSHNIANANTPGFSRQDVILRTTDPYTVPTASGLATTGQVGTGVEVTAIRRLRDLFLDGQIRLQNGKQGEQQAIRDALKQIEVIFNEPSTSGMATMLSRFFNAWQEVANKPEDRAIRAALVEEARNFAATAQRNNAQLTQIRTDINQQIQLKTAEVNSIAGRIAALNAQISQVEGVGQQPNDLRDQRDLLLDQLSKLVQISQATNANGSVNVFIGSSALVLGNDALLLTNGTNSNGDTTVLWASTGAAVTLNSGELQGLITARDGTLADQQTAFNLLISTIITEVNALHATGYGLTDTVAPNRAFFSGADASTIAVNPAVAADPGLVAAAAAANLPGDNSIALAIAKLRDGLTMSSNTATFHMFYQSITSTLGTAARQAGTAAENQRALVNLLIQRKQSVAGVNLDEEATNLIKYQHAYQAAARVVSAVDEMLDRIINGMGRVGL
jgi:flagellar hook-associated protein 1 FlgK